MKKRGSLSLSMNAIVVIVLAITMLGLGITLTQNFLNTGTELGTGILSSSEEQILDQLRRSGEPISVQPDNIVGNIKDTKELTVAVSNVNDVVLNYQIRLDEIKSDGTLETQSVADGALGAGEFFWDLSPQTLEPSDGNIHDVSFKLADTKGIKRYRVTIWDTDADAAYDHETFVVDVR